MKINFRGIHRILLYMSICCVLSLVVPGCSLLHIPADSSPGGALNGFAPTLKGLVASPNPASPGTMIQLTTNYNDSDADLQYGVAAVSVDGGELSRIAFQTSYASGILSIPLAISHYSRPSDVNIVLKIRDSAGNWSNAVSTVLSIR